MENSRKRIMQDFQRHLTENFTDYVNRHDLEPDLDNFITYMIDLDLIPPVNIKRYTVLQDFEQIYPQKKTKKTHAAEVISDKYQLSIRSVWSILKGNNNFGKHR